MRWEVWVMNLKSLVNKSIVKSDLRRFWYLGAAFLVGMLLLVTIPAIQSLRYDESYSGRMYGYISDLGLVGILPFGIIMPAVLFSYLHKKSAVCATHSLPLMRECVFISHIISGVILTVVPLIANMLIMLSVNELYSPDVLQWFGLSLVYCVLVSGMSIFASAVAGNVFASIAIPAILMLLPIGTAAMYEGLADCYLYGFSLAGEMSFTSLISEWYLSYDKLASVKMLVYIAIGLIFTIIGYICYKKRALENNSLVTAFKSLNPVFTYGVAIYGGLLGAFYIGAVADIFSLWFAIPFGILGIVVAKMLITKTFKPKNIVKPSLIFAVIIAVLYTIFGLDITGYEKRIPDINEIASVDISGRFGDYERYAYYEDERYLVAPEAIEKTELTDKSDIEKVVKLHKSIVDEPYRTDYEQAYLPVCYRLKNGKVLVREYWYTPTSAQKEMRFEIDDIQIVKAYKLPLISDRECRYVSGHIYRDNEETVNITADLLTKYIETIKRDINNTTAKDRLGEPIIRIELRVDFPVADGLEKYVHQYTEHETYNIYPTYTNTIELLESDGII